MFCANCGKKLEDGWKICPSCGQKIVADEYNETHEKEEAEQELVFEKTDVPRRNKQKKSEISTGIIIGGISIVVIIGIIIIGILLFAKNGKSAKGESELFLLCKVTEDELIAKMRYDKNAGGFYPSDRDVIFSCKDGAISSVFLGEQHKDDNTFLGVKIGDDVEASKTSFEKGYTFVESKAGEDGYISDFYVDDSGSLVVKSDMQTKKITSITYTSGQLPSSGEAGQKAAQTAIEDPPTEKVNVKDDGYDTVVTIKSQNVDYIQLYTTAGGTQTAGKVQEGVCCAQLDKKKVDGEKWVLLDFCDRQGWCPNDKVRTVSGQDAKYFYVRSDRDNIVFVNENSIKLHSEAKQKSNTPVTGITYGTELNIKELNNGWGLTTYQSNDYWVDMNVVGFYASEYWQVERADGSTTGIKLRKTSEEDSEELSKVPLKTVINPTEYKDGWGKIKYDGETGWLKLHYATPCGSSEGIKTEDTTESTQKKTEVSTQTESAPKQSSTHSFAGYCYPASCSYYAGDGEHWMNITNVTDHQFTFTIYDYNGVCFRTHTAVASGPDTAVYDGKDYYLVFYLDSVGMEVTGCSNVIGSYDYFWNEYNY